MKMEFTKLRPDLQSIIDQIMEFRTQYSNLQKKCRKMEDEHRLDIADINREHAEQIIRMEEESEILKSQLAGLEELHREEICRLEKRNELEKLNFEKTVNTLKNEINDLRMALEKNIEFNTHPAFHKSIVKKQSQQKKSTTPIFKWPPLEVQISKSSTQKSADVEITKSKKKRKLYTVDEDAVVDITLKE